MTEQKTATYPCAHAEACGCDLARMREDVKRREVESAKPGNAPNVGSSSPAARSRDRGWAPLRAGRP